jgi:hypothetical protein
MKVVRYLLACRLRVGSRSIPAFDCFLVLAKVFIMIMEIKNLIASFLCTFALLVITVPILGQQNFSDFKNESFENLTINVSSVEDTIKLLGKPDVNKTNAALDFSDGSNWFKNWFADFKEKKSFQKLVYKNLPNYQEATFYFLDDKLVWVMARMKNPFIGEDTPYLSPNKLDTVFDVEFKTFRWAFGRKLPPAKDFEVFTGHKLEKDVPFYYLRIGMTEKTVVANLIDNNDENLTAGFLKKKFSLTRKKREEMNSLGEFPGYVSTVHIISRQLISK